MGARITATDAARNLSDLLNKVRYRGETFDVVRGGEVVARLVPAGTAQGEPTLRNLFERLDAVARPDDTFVQDLESIQRDQHPPSEDPWGT